MDRVTETRFGPPPPEQPVVSVLMITYNHEAFIREAIESVFMQEVDFPIELVIGEDCSTDGTRKMIHEVCRAAPIPVRLLTSAGNVGMHENFRRTLRACRGEYVALLEGDDAWTARSKLSCQVVVFRNKEIVLCYHSVAIKRESPEDTRQLAMEKGDLPWPTCEMAPLTISALASTIIVPPTASTMFRRSSFPDLPPWFVSLPWCDFPMHVLLFSRGSVRYICECMAMYRVHAGGVTSKVNPVAYTFGLARTFCHAFRNVSVTSREVLLAAALEYSIRYLESARASGHGLGSVVGGSIALLRSCAWNQRLGRVLLKNVARLYCNRTYSVMRGILMRFGLMV